MIRFEIYETCTTNYTNYIAILDDVVNSFLKDCRNRGLSEDDTADELREYLQDIKWDYVEHREIVDEDSDDYTIDDDTFGEAVDESMSWYEEPSKKFMGDFGND